MIRGLLSGTVLGALASAALLFAMSQVLPIVQIVQFSPDPPSVTAFVTEPEPRVETVALSDAPFAITAEPVATVVLPAPPPPSAVPIPDADAAPNANTASLSAPETGPVLTGIAAPPSPTERGGVPVALALVTPPASAAAPVEPAPDLAPALTSVPPDALRPRLSNVAPSAVTAAGALVSPPLGAPSLGIRIRTAGVQSLPPLRPADVTAPVAERALPNISDLTSPVAGSDLVALAVPSIEAAPARPAGFAAPSLPSFAVVPSQPPLGALPVTEAAPDALAERLADPLPDAVPADPPETLAEATQAVSEDTPETDPVPDPDLAPARDPVPDAVAAPVPGPVLVPDPFANLAPDPAPVPDPLPQPTAPPAADGPAITAFAAGFNPATDNPLLGVILLDDPAGQALALNTLGYPVSVAVDPLGPGAAARMADLRAAGVEVLVLAPVAEGANPRDLEVFFQSYFGKISEAVAVMDMPDAGLQSSRQMATQVVEILQASGHGLVTYNKGLNAAVQLAERGDVPVAKVARVFDEKGTEGFAVRRMLDQGAFQSGRDGTAVVVGSLRRETLDALEAWRATSKGRTVEFAPISVVLQR